MYRCMCMGIICVFQENANKTQHIFCRTYLADFCHFCRTHVTLSDISCVFWSFLSDTSSCGHIWLCRTYLAGTGLLTEHRFRLERYGRRCFSVAGPALWNELPTPAKECQSFQSFKAKLKTHLFRQAFRDHV